jgi:hypothetical protein
MVPGRLLIVFAALGTAGSVSGYFPDTDKAFLIFTVLVFLLLGGLFLAVLACPRCGRNAYRRSDGRSHDLRPNSKCSRCGLDLKAFSPFDGRAKDAP